MAGNLLTATLLDAYQWYQDAPEIPRKDNRSITWKESAYKDLLDKIRRVGTFEPTPEIQRGMDFENKVCNNLALVREDFLALFDESCRTDMELFYDKCKGGEQQRPTSGEIEVDGMLFYLFGYIDIFFPSVKIQDIKTTGSYKGPEKYLGRHQHLIYMYCEKVYWFEYIVAAFREYKDSEGKIISSRLDKTHLVTIHSSEDEVVKRLTGRIRNFKRFLEKEDLMGEYLTLFCKGKGTPTGR